MSRLEVSVVDVRGVRLPKANVQIHRLGTDDEKPVRLRYDRAADAFVGESVTRGRYQVVVRATGVESDERVVDVGGGTNREKFVLGKKGLPHYYQGRVRVPFQPSGLIGVALKPSSTQDDLVALERQAAQLRLTKADDAQVAREYGTQLYRLPPRTSASATGKIVAQLERAGPVRAVGLVVEAGPEAVTFLTRQIIARFHADVRDDDVGSVAKQFGLSPVRKLPYVPNGWLLQAGVPASHELLSICEGLVRSGRVVYAEPNTVRIVTDLAINPTDWLAPEQWHLPIVNLPNAWDTLRGANPAGVNPGDPGDLTFGSANVVVAIMDRGIQSNTVAGATTAVHRDFQGNVTTGASKVSQFQDFTNMVPNNNAPPNSHGMGCAGVAGARVSNPSVVAGTNEGVVGAAPNCRLFGAIRPTGGTDQQYADAFVFMAGFNPGWTVDGVNYPAGTVFPALPAAPADIISNSYGWSAGLSGVMSDMIDYVTSFGRDGRGVAIFWAAGNGNAVCNLGTATHPKVFAVAASTLANDGTTEVRGAYSNFGNAIEFCAPSHDAYVGGSITHNPPTNYGVISAELLTQGNMPGAPAQLTTLTAAAGPSAGAINLPVVSSAGFAAGQAVLIGAPGATGTEAQLVASIPNATSIRVNRLRNLHGSGTAVAGGSADYTDTFGGTSSATPLAAGIAALCLSVNPELTWVELRDILRTTATRIDLTNTNATGQWVDTTGDGVVNFSQWYGWGRLDANAAVIAARDYGHEIDLVVRDNLADTGATPSGGWHAASPDIWTDPNNVPIPALAYGAAPPHVRPVRGQDNYVFVRVKNVGTRTSSDYWVRALISHYPGFEFRFPQEWTPSNLPGQPVPTPLVPGSYLIDEVPMTALAPGANTIVKMTWDSTLVPDDTVMVAGIPVRWHPCLLAQVSPHDGPPPSGATFDVKRYNNLAHRNITIDDPADTDSDLVTAVVAGTSDLVGIDSIVIDRTLVPADYRVLVRIADELVMARWRNLVKNGAVVAADPLPGSRVIATKPGGFVTDEPVSSTEDDHCRIVMLDPARVAIRCCDGRLIVVHAPSRTEFECVGGGGRPNPHMSLAKVFGQEVLIFDHGGADAIELPLRMAGGHYVPVVLGLMRPGGRRGGAQLFATQRRGDGELSAGYTVAG